MKQNLSAIIVDDEEHCRESLVKQLEWSCPEVEVIGLAHSMQTGLELLNNIQPDILFLDIQMPGGNGFDLIKQLVKPSFDIIFTTAYDSYALEAFRANAIDYLLKPIDGAALENAVSKVSKSPMEGASSEIDKLIAHLALQKSPKKVAFPVAEGLEFVIIDDIIRCASEGAYCRIFIHNKQNLFLSKTIKQVTELINNEKFQRVHHSHLVNTDFIKSYIRGKGGQVIMEDGTTIPVSRSRKDDFLGQV